MRNILLKEFKLSASKLSFLFIIFSLMFFIPNYPILCGPFFVTLGIFQSYQNYRLNNDILFSTLLPISKKQLVKGKYLFVVIIEAISFVIMLLAVILRATLFKNANAYLNNPLMNANGFALGSSLLIFGVFNLVFIGGFFKTAYKFVKPFVLYIVICFIIIAIGETLHHIPGMEFLNAFGTENIILQIIFALLGVFIFFISTYVSYVKSCKKLDKIDL